MSQTPIVRPVSWLNAGVTLGILAVFLVIGFVLNRSVGVVVGAGLYLALSQSLRNVIAQHHRNGVRHSKRKEF